MFKRLLVPLDGSHLAESVLPATRYLAEHFQAAIILFHVIEQGAPATIHGQRHLLRVDEAQAYLDEIAARLARPGISIEKHVHSTEETDVARSIISHGDELHADLVILCAHGHGGLRDILVGTIAQQVIQRGTLPVFFVRPKGTDDEPPFECRKVLVPLDSTALHEPAVPLAAEMARVCGAAIHVMTVVPTTSTLPAEYVGTGLLLPTAMTAVLDLAQRGAQEYLRGIVRGLLAQGLPVTATVVRGDPPSMILSTAQSEGASVIVMATHGRGNFEAFWEGSVTPKVMSRSSVPVLLVRVVRAE